MSLINKVLKDLESRERASGDHPPSAMLEDLRAAPTPEKNVSLRAYGWALGAAVAAVLLVAVGVEYGQRTSALHAPQTGSLAAKKVVARSPRSAPVIMTSVPPVAAVRGKAVSHRRIAVPKTSALRVRTPTAPLTHVGVPHRFVSRKATSGSRSPGSFHFYGAGISRHAVPPTRAERSAAQYRLAIASLRQGKAGAARRDLKAALGLVPGAVSPSLLLAGLEVRAGQLKAAQRVLARGFALHPQVSALIMLLAQVDLRLGQPAEALGVLAKVSPEAQTEPYWALLAASRLRDGNVKAAVHAYEDGLQRFAHSGGLWVGLGLADSERGHPRAAHEAFIRAQKCALDPVLARFVHQELSSLP